MRKKIFILLCIYFMTPVSAYSFPQYLDIFNKDQFARPEKKNKCSVCHVSPAGGGPLNDFGKTFDANGHKITNDLRQKFPELFDLLKSLEPKIIRIKPIVFIVGKETKTMILGNNFANDSVVKVDGNDASVESTFVNSKRIDLTITFSEAGVHTIQIVNVTGQTSKVFKIKVKATKI